MDEDRLAEPSSSSKKNTPGFYALTQHLSALSPTYFGKRFAMAATSAQTARRVGGGDDGGSGATPTPTPTSTSALLELRLGGEDAMLDPAQMEDFLNAVALEGRLKPTRE
jgi:hypothetical protein